MPQLYIMMIYPQQPAIHINIAADGAAAAAGAASGSRDGYER